MKKLDKMNLRELRKLRKKIKEKRTQLFKEEAEVQHRWSQLEDQIKQSRSTIGKINYRIGKKRAEDCPAFSKVDKGTAKCMVGYPKYNFHIQALIKYYCSSCRLHRKTRLIKGTLNGVFT